jgi:hypothetical protein
MMRETALLLAILLVCANGVNWQASGNMSASNMSVVNSYIQTNFSSTYTNEALTVAAYTTITDFTTAFSTELNRQWDEAWNVVVVHINNARENVDSVLYGYAFRDHWMWFNGYAMDDGYYVGFIIWKDYNCLAWNTIRELDFSADTTFDATTNALITAAFTNFKSHATYGNVWVTAEDFVAFLINSNAAFQGSDKAFTLIMSESLNA